MIYHFLEQICGLRAVGAAKTCKNEIPYMVYHGNFSDMLIVGLFGGYYITIYYISLFVVKLQATGEEFFRYKSAHIY